MITSEQRRKLMKLINKRVEVEVDLLRQSDKTSREFYENRVKSAKLSLNDFLNSLEERY